MSKVPCGGFKLDENFFDMNENDELSLTSGSSEGEAFKQLVTDGDGGVKWEDRLAYTQTIPGSDGPVLKFFTYDYTIFPLTLSEPLIVGAPYTVNIGGDECKTTCTKGADEFLYIFVSVQGSAQGSLIVTDPINNPLDARWNGAMTNKWITIVRESQEEAKQIDPKYIPNTDVFFVLSGSGFRTGTDWDAGEDATIADIVSAYHDGGARIFQMSSGECIGISNVIGASASGSSSSFITYYDYTSKTVFTKS